MPILNRLTLTAAAAAIAWAAPKPGLAETNMLFILDGSNSMWGQVEGVAKIKTAQDVLTDLITDLPKDTKVGLMVYGHRSKVSCDDIEILSSIGADGPAELVRKIKSIQPAGKTPIANALLGSMVAFSKLEGQNNHVVLISDGIETCGGDVCMAASAIANANIKPRVHVVGFDVGAKERAQLECIPKMGNGKYFSAANAGELKKAIAQVKQVAQAAPKPPQPKKKGLTAEAAKSGAASESCEFEKTARSISDDILTEIHFSNRTGDVIRMFWLDYQGERKFYNTLPPDKEYTQRTFVTHPWVVTDANDVCLRLYYSSPQPTHVVVKPTLP